MHGFSGKPRGFCCGSQGTGRPSAGRPSSRASSASSAGFSAATSQGRGEGRVLTPSACCQAFVLVTPAPGTCWVQRVGGTCFGRRWGWGRSAEFDLRQAGATEEEAEGGGSGWLFGANAGPQTFGPALRPSDELLPLRECWAPGPAPEKVPPEALQA